jgi:hypothetical protein
MKIHLLTLSFILILSTSLSVVAQGINSGKEDFAFQYRTEPVKTVQIYPNPAVEFVNVKFEAPVANKVHISVRNVIGNVMEVETESLDEYEIRIKVKDLATGYYLLSVKDERVNLNSTYKFLKR